MANHQTPPNFKDLSGQRFGRLTVIERVKNGSQWKVRWECICDCGSLKVAASSNLKSGNTQSCGCFQMERIKASATKHGMSKKRTYKA
jgi:hypothetical protein